MDGDTSGFLGHTNAATRTRRRTQRTRPPISRTGRGRRRWKCAECQTWCVCVRLFMHVYFDVFAWIQLPTLIVNVGEREAVYVCVSVCVMQWRFNHACLSGCIGVIGFAIASAIIVVRPATHMKVLPSSRLLPNSTGTPALGNFWFRMACSTLTTVSTPSTCVQKHALTRVRRREKGTGGHTNKNKL